MLVPRRFPILVTSLVLLSGASVRAQSQNPPPELTEILALPVSVGSTAMLARLAPHQAAQAKLSAALKNADPDVRTVAARVVTATASRGLLPEVRTQLASESDPIAATELARTLATLGEVSDDALLLATAQKVGYGSVATIGEALARVRPKSLEALAVELAKIAAYTTGGRLARACAQRPELLMRMAIASQRGGRLVWIGFLHENHQRGIHLDSAIWLGGLKSADPDIRLATAHFAVVEAGHPGNEIDQEVLQAIAISPGDALDWSAAYAELARRALKQPARKFDWGTLISASTKDARDALQLVPAQLLGDDRERIEKALGDLMTRAEGLKRLDLEPRRLAVLRTVPLVAGNLLGDLMDISHCRQSDSFALAEIAHRHDGRPVSITPSDRSLSTECQRMAEVMFSLSVAPAGYDEVSGAVDRVLVPLDQQFVQCARQRPDLIAFPTGDAVKVDPPKILSRPAYSYPQGATARGTIESTLEISANGCVRSVEVNRSLDLLPDMEALRIQLRSRMQPLRIDGKALASSTTEALLVAPDN